MPGTPGGHQDEVYQQVLQVGTQSYFLEGAQAPANGPVRATGTVAGQEFTATAVVSTGTMAAIPTTGVTKTLVILAYWTQPDTVTQASAATQMFGDTAAWFSEVSYGRMTQSGDVTPWLAIAGPSTGCYADSGTLMAQARSAAAARGYDPTSYGNVVLYFPRCFGDAAGYAGWAYVGSSGTWLNAFLDRRVTTHEIGHNLGLWHSNSNLCSGGGLSGTCTFREYGDDYDAMGASNYVGHFSASQKARIGWLDGRLVDLSAGGQTTLGPLTSLSPGAPQAGVISMPSGRQYWLEYRRPLGFDASLLTGGMYGLLVHVTGPGSNSPNNGPSLLDVSPSDGISVTTAVLKVGQTWTSPEGTWIRASAFVGTNLAVSAGTGNPPPSPPGGPADLSLSSDPAARSVTVTWSPPTQDGGSPVTGYRVWRSGVDASGQQSASVVVSASTRSFTFANLVPAELYTVGVEAINLAGNGPTDAGFIAFPAVPSAPTSFAVTADNAARKATITWAPPTSNGGMSITGYQVSRNGTDSAGSGPWSTTVPATARSQTFNLLVPGTAYTLSVRAVSADGTGAAASGTVTLTSATAPGVPTSVAATGNAAARSVTLSWAPPTSTGGSAITGYRVARDGTDAGGGGPWSTVLPATARSQTFTPLVLGTKYTFTVQAINAAGTGVAGSASATLTAVPGTPTSVAVAKNVAGRSATLTWAPPTSSGGSAITGYKVSRTGTDANGNGPWSTVVPATARSQTFNLLVPGSSYSFSVQAVNAVGTGAAGTVSTTFASLPGAVSNLAVTRNATAKSATITWAPPTQTGGSAITGYVIRRDGVNSAGSASWTTTVAASARTQTFTMLVPGTTYTFSVSAKNAVGTGSAASIATVLPNP